jgi:hypothetical protein
MYRTNTFLRCLLGAMLLCACGSSRPAVPVPVEQVFEQYILNRCSGVDTPCGRAWIVELTPLTISPTMSGNLAAAWCADYTLQRRNTGRFTGLFLPWRNIPEAVIVVEQRDGVYDTITAANCEQTVL